MNVSVTHEHPSDIDAAAIVDLATLVIRAEGYPDTTEVSIRTVSDAEIAALKAEWMGVDAATDVLSFPIDEQRPGVVPAVDPDGPPLLLGDIVLAPDFIGRQASEFGVAPREELSLMVVHGLLHLMGWDHEVDDEAEAMEERERQLLATVGVVRR